VGDLIRYIESSKHRLENRALALRSAGF
jgi:hypothetical protein